MKKIYALLFMVMVFTNSLFAYSYASAGKEPTLDAQDGILNAINANDFKKAKDVFVEYKDHYDYLTKDFNSKLSSSLEKAISEKNKALIIKWLRVSMACEIERRIDGGRKNINNFNVAKVMLAKANKFYKLLAPNLDFKTNKALKKALKNCTIAIGNPGLFGVGAKPVDEQLYKTNEKIALDILKAL